MSYPRSPSPSGGGGVRRSRFSVDEYGNSVGIGYAVPAFILIAIAAGIAGVVLGSITLNRTNAMCSPGILEIKASQQIDPYSCVQTLDGGPNLTIIYLGIDPSSNPSYIGKTYRVISLDGIQHVLWAPPGTYFHGAYTPVGTTQIIFNYNDPGLTGSCLEITPITDAFVQVCACGGNGNGFFYGVYKKKKGE